MLLWVNHETMYLRDWLPLPFIQDSTGGLALFGGQLLDSFNLGVSAGGSAKRVQNVVQLRELDEVTTHLTMPFTMPLLVVS
jgi:hypothetical protein